MTQTHETVVILEDIRSVYNVGSAFRTADAAGIDKLILTGKSAHPPHPRLKKTALGSSQSVSWEYHQEIQPYLEKVKEEGFSIVSMEASDESVNLYKTTFDSKLCLIFGNEVNGVSHTALQLSDLVCRIPMLGAKTSLNISVSLGVTVYERLRQLQSHLETD